MSFDFTEQNPNSALCYQVFMNGDCVSLLLLCNKLVQTWWLKMTPTFYQAVSLGQKSRWAWQDSQVRDPNPGVSQAGVYLQALRRNLLPDQFGLWAEYGSSLVQDLGCIFPPGWQRVTPSSYRPLSGPHYEAFSFFKASNGTSSSPFALNPSDFLPATSQR